MPCVYGSSFFDMCDVGYVWSEQRITMESYAEHASITNDIGVHWSKIDVLRLNMKSGYNYACTL